MECPIRPDMQSGLSTFAECSLHVTGHPLLLVQRKSAECSFVSLTQLVSAPFDEDLLLTLRFKTVEVNASSCLPSLVPSASDDWNL